MSGQWAELRCLISRALLNRSLGFSILALTLLIDAKVHSLLCQSIRNRILALSGCIYRIVSSRSPRSPSRRTLPLSERMSALLLIIIQKSITLLILVRTQSSPTPHQSAKLMNWQLYYSWPRIQINTKTFYPRFPCTSLPCHSPHALSILFFLFSLSYEDGYKLLFGFPIIQFCNKEKAQYYQMNPEELITAKEREKIQIFIEGKDYDVQHKFQSFLVVKQSARNSSLDKEILRTKSYKEDSSPKYQEDFIIHYYFEKTQYLTFILYVNNCVFGKIEGVLLYDVFKNKTNELIFFNQNKKQVGKLFLHSNIISVKDQDRVFEGSVRVKTSSIKPSEKYFFKILRWDYHANKKQEIPLEVYCSDSVAGSSQDKEAEWPSFKISENRLSLNNDSSNLQIFVYRYSPMALHGRIGKFQFTLADLKRGQENSLIEGDRKIGTICFTSIIRKHNQSFLGYIDNGLEINSVIFIDFTESNKPHSDIKSNHYVGSQKDSKYEEIINATLDPILKYDTDKKAPVFGFGCTVNHDKIKTGARLSPLFPINMDVTDPYLHSLQEIKKAYRQCMKYLKFSGPTYFSPLIKWAAEEGKKYLKNTDHHQYMIMFILTDGQLCDEEKVMDLIVECSSLPISIVIIGIGNQDFSTMREFDKCELIDSKGNRTLRDLVKFVEYDKFKGDLNKLSEEVLEQIPRHVESYFALRKSQHKQQ